MFSIQIDDEIFGGNWSSFRECILWLDMLANRGQSITITNILTGSFHTFHSEDWS